MTSTHADNARWVQSNSLLRVMPDFSPLISFVVGAIVLRARAVTPLYGIPSIDCNWALLVGGMPSVLWLRLGVVGVGLVQCKHTLHESESPLLLRLSLLLLSPLLLCLA